MRRNILFRSLTATRLSDREEVNRSIPDSVLKALALLHHNERRHDSSKGIPDASVLVALHFHKVGHELAQRGVLIHIPLVIEVIPSSKKLDREEECARAVHTPGKLNHSLACTPLAPDNYFIMLRAIRAQQETLLYA
jgi:hypothetical protein